MLKKLSASIVIIAFLVTQINCILSYSTDARINGVDFLNSLDKLIQESEAGFNASISQSQGTKRLIIKTNNNNPINTCNAVATVEGFCGLHIFQYDTSAESNNAVEYYKSLNEVVCVEEDSRIDINCFSDQSNAQSIFDVRPQKSDWACVAINSESAIRKIEESGSPRDVVVAVVDSGIDYSHEFFDSSRLIDSRASAYSTSSTFDDYGHGTFVAGIIYNNVPSNVKISGYKVLNSEGGSSYAYVSKIIATIESAIADDVDVINMSFGGYVVLGKSQGFINAILDAYSKNIPVIAASGNNGILLTGLEIPASIKPVITVASIDTNLQPSSFSNYGLNVKLSAPGQTITSCIPYDNNLIFETKTGKIDCNHHNYLTSSGTSAAAPFVSAACAVLKTINKDYSVDDITSILQISSYKPENWKEPYYQNYGAGILDMASMLNIKKSKDPYIRLTENGASIISESSNAKIYYTTDNSIPTTESNLYNGMISTAGVRVIKAIAVENGCIPSNIISYSLVLDENISVRYKGTKQVKFPLGYRIKHVYDCDNKIATLKMNGEISGVSVGETVAVAEFTNNCRITYHIHVEYAWWQQLIRYFLFGFLWY